MIEEFIEKFREELVFKEPEKGDPVLIFTYGAPSNINEIRVGYITEVEDDSAHKGMKVFTILFFFPHSRFRIVLPQKCYMGEVVFKLHGKESWFSAIKDIKVLKQKEEPPRKKNGIFTVIEGGKLDGNTE